MVPKINNIISNFIINYFIYEHIFSNKLCKLYFDYEIDVNINDISTNEFFINVLKQIIPDVIDLFRVSQC